MENISIKEKIYDHVIKENGEKKKVILSNLSTVNLLAEGTRLLSKLERNITIYEDNSDDIIVIFCKQRDVEIQLERFKKELLDQYRQVVEAYSLAQWCIMINYEDLDKVYDLCDVYYGDWTIGAWRCRYMKKKVMILNVDV